MSASSFDAEKRISTSPCPTLNQIGVSTTTNNIKERLNLHVKRRLQETTTTASSAAALTTPIPAKRTGSSGGHQSQVRGVKKNKGKTQAQSSMVVPPSPEDEGSRDCNSNEIIPGIEKDSAGPDILTIVLNEKRLSLIRDPEVIQFLSNIMGLIRK